MTIPSRNVVISFAIHLFTASGAVWALLALVALIHGDLNLMWIWLGVALIVDGVDGPLARKFEVKEHLPNWSGETLDMVIDYITYAFIPAFVIYQQGLFDKWLNGWMTLIIAAAIVITSIFYPAKKNYMSKDKCFIGFPICWNMLLFVLFILEPNTNIALAIVILSLLLTFTPLLFIHPVRVPVFAKTNISVSTIWGICGGIALYYSFFGISTPEAVKIIIIITSLYLYFVGIALQAFGKAA